MDENKTKEQLIKELADLRKEFDSFKEQSKLNMLQSQLTESALSRSRTFLNETGRMAKVGGWEFTPGIEEIRWTDEVYRIHGVEFSYLPTLSKGIDFYAPDSKPVIEKAVQEAMESGKSFDLELEIITPGRDFKWVHVIGKANFRDGKLTTISGTFQDITERKKSEKELAREKFLFTSLMDNLPDAIYFKDLESRFLRINKACAFVNGFKAPDEAIGKSDFDLFTEEHSMPAYNDEQEIIRTGQPKSMAERETRINQPDKWVSTVKMPLYNNEGKIIGTFGISKDITQHIEDEEKLQILVAEKDKFFSILAHDLRGPLSAFVSATQILTDDIQSMDMEDIKDITISMKISASNIYSLLENLLEWSRLMRNKLDFVPSTINLKEKVEDCIGVLSEYAGKKKIEIEISTPDEATIIADSHMFETIIRNLVSNAIKFTPIGGKVNVVSENRPDRSVEIRISDNGIGMNEDIMNNLFKITEKTNRSGTEGEPSTGLGLLLCKEFVEKHGSKILVESEVGKGTTFRFTMQGGDDVKR